MNKYLATYATFIIFVLLTVSSLLAAERTGTLILGAVESNPKKEAAVLQPMVDYAASRMREVGIAKGEILIAKTREELIQALREGRVDWVTDTPFPVLLMMEQAGAEMVARRWKNGVSEYASLYFVHRESPVNTVEALRGQLVAFGDLDSTTTYFVPLSVLREKGLTGVERASIRDALPPDQVGYVFAGDQANIFNWVQRRLVTAGVASTTDWEEFKALHEHFRVINQTKPFPRSVELVRRDLDAKVKVRLREVLLGAEQDPEAREALKAYKKTRKFDAMDGEAMAGMENAREILDRIRDVVQ